MHPQHIFMPRYTTIFVACKFFWLGLVACTTKFLLVNSWNSSWTGTEQYHLIVFVPIISWGTLTTIPSDLILVSLVCLNMSMELLALQGEMGYILGVVIVLWSSVWFLAWYQTVTICHPILVWYPPSDNCVWLKVYRIPTWSFRLTLSSYS